MNASRHSLLHPLFELLHRLVDGEAGGFLPGRKLSNISVRDSAAAGISSQLFIQLLTRICWIL
jgi:hypothetical protein